MSPPRTRRKLLVVDDDADTRRALRDSLEEEGYQVATASDGHDALSQLEHGLAPELLLVDLCMPGMDGWTLVKAMRHEDHLAGIPVVVMSAGGTRIRATAPAHAIGYLSKPLDLTELIGIVQKHCG